MRQKIGTIGSMMTTYSGGWIDLLDPKPEQVKLIDIAHGLSNTCRFNGQCRDFYSVAQHSVMVSLNVPDEFAMGALFHDAAEAYIGDMVSPLKQYLPGFKAVEDRLMRVIWAGLLGHLPDKTKSNPVKLSDMRALATEKRDLINNNDDWNGLDEVMPFSDVIQPLTPEIAKLEWLERYSAILHGKSDD